MGLLDIVNGMQSGPSGQRQPSDGSTSAGGMSPITMGLLGLLAYKALKSFGGSQAVPADGSGPAPGGSGTAGSPGGLGDILGGLLGGARPGGTGNAIPGGGSLSDILGGLFGGAPGSARPGGSVGNSIPGGLGGAAAGSVLSGGLGNLIKELQNSGQGLVAKSWVGAGPNEEIAPDRLEKALGADTIDALAKQTGMDRGDLLDGFSKHLPGLVDHLTPNGRLPTEQEASRMM